MTPYIEYPLDESTTVLIESLNSEVEGTTKGLSSHADLIVISKAQKSFSEALKSIKAQAKLLLKEREDIHVSDAEVKFGVNTVGELGNMAIGNLGGGVTYAVTLKWKKPENSR